MEYIKENWIDVPDPSNPPEGAIPIDATIMNKIETGIVDALSSVSAQATAIADAKKTGTDAQNNLNSHLLNTSNPHGVTASQIGAATSSHTHSKSQITDFPSSMPASDVYSWAKQPNKPSYTASEVGASPTGHKHSAADINSGTLGSDRLPTVPVTKGGTGKTTVTANNFLVGNGTSAMQEKTPAEVFNLIGAHKIVSGVYTGNTVLTSNGSELVTQKINLGFTPKGVIVSCDGEFADWAYSGRISGFCVQGYPLKNAAGDDVGLEIVDGGFNVTSRNHTSYNGVVHFNDKNHTYQYMAWE